jgi:hypothetical protein
MYTSENTATELRGKSTDAKPILPANQNGSVYYEMDTRRAYMWDGDALAWLPQWRGHAVMAIDVVTLALAKKYTDDTALGAGAVQIPGPQGPPGTDGTDGVDGVGVPAGGLPGQVLAKRTAADHDTEWAVPAEAGGYTHDQATPSAQWEILHGLGNPYAQAVIVDSSGNRVTGATAQPLCTANLLVIRFSEPISGKAYVR